MRYDGTARIWILHGTLSYPKDLDPKTQIDILTIHWRERLYRKLLGREIPDYSEFIDKIKRTGKPYNRVDQ